MSQLSIDNNSSITTSAPEVRLVDVRVVTKRKKLTAAERRTVDACDRIVEDPATTWHDWKDVRKQLGL